MNTFRRPMFRGGKVDSRGTGITSGLSYAKGGRVGLQGGGMPPTGGVVTGRALMNVPQPPKYSRPIGPPTGGLGMGTGKFRFPMMSSQARAAMGLGFPSLSTLGLMSLPFAPTAAMAAMNMPKTDAALQFMKDAPDFTFDETNIDVGDFYDELSRKNKEGTPISTLDAFLLDPKTGTYPKFMGRLEDREKRAAIEKAKIGKQTEDPLDDKEQALTADQLKILELEKLIEGMTKVEPKAKDKDMEESVEIDKEKFAKILGKDKARGQDISDMLLSFSSKALAPDATVKSAFAEFVADEVKRPSRMRKIDDSAAALAINKYIKGEISRAEADQYIKRIELTQKLRDESNIKTAAEYIQAADEPGFVKKVKVGLNSYYAQEGLVPKYEVVKSKDMDDPEKFKFSQDDVGVIFIEEDTREVYTFDTSGNKRPIINM